MMRDGRPERAIHALARFWDGLVQGNSTDADALDPTLAATVQHLRVHDDAPGADPAFAARLLADLQNMQQTGQQGRATPAYHVTARESEPLSANGRVPAPDPWSMTRRAAVPVRPRRRWAAFLVAAALLVLGMLAAGYLAFGPGWRSIEQRAIMPAPVAPAPTGPTIAPVLNVAIPQEYIPRWDIAWAGLAHHVIPAESASTWTTPALRVEYAMRGTYLVRSSGPARIVRAGSDFAEEIPPGEEFLIEPGDALIAPPQTTTEYENPADSVVDVLSWVMVEGDGRQHAKPPSWLAYDTDIRHELTQQAESLALVVNTIVLAPDEILPAPPDALQFSITLPDPGTGTFSTSAVAQARNGDLQNLGPEAATIYTATLEAIGRGPLMP